jgi:hypothetical protein
MLGLAHTLIATERAEVMAVMSTARPKAEVRRMMLRALGVHQHEEGEQTEIDTPPRAAANRPEVPLSRHLHAPAKILHPAFA